MNRYVNAFVTGVPYRQLPLYAGMVLLFGIMGILSITILSKHGGSVQEAERMATLFSWLILSFALMPAVFGVVSMGKEVYSEYHG